MNHDLVPADLVDRMLREIERQNALIRTMASKLLIGPDGACRLCGFMDSQTGHERHCLELNKESTLPEVSTLGHRLREISDKALASGTKVLSADEINDHVAEIRGASPKEEQRK